VSTLRAFYELGVRCVALSRYERRVSNTVGGDLDPFARELIREMDRLGMLIDVSHLLEEGFWQVVEATAGPFVDTHANAYTLCPHPRNLKDDQLRVLAERGGVIGVMAYHPYVHPAEPTLERMLDHVDYLVELLGPDHVGLGLDFDGMGGAGQHAVLRDAAEVPRITAGLLARGYDEASLRKILGENWRRVFRTVMG
jgi:membrane dipeptidase